MPRFSKKILQGVPKASQGVPKASPDVHPRRPQDLPRHPQGLPKRVHGETYNFVKIVLPSRRNTNFSGLPRYMLTPSWPRATMLAHVGPKLTPSCCMLAPVGLKLAQVDPKLTPSWPQVGPWDQSWSHLGPILEPSWPPGTPQGSPGTPTNPQGTIFHQLLIKVGLIFNQNSIIFEVHCSPTFDVDVRSNFNTDFMLSFIFLFNAATSLQVSQPPSLQSPIASAGIAKRKQSAVRLSHRAC